MSVELSVLVPGIRSHKWQALYDSIGESFSGSWEMVIIGPFEPSEELMSKGNVIYIKDFGSPIRCQQIGLLQCNGEYVTWAADDGVYFPKSLDIGFNLLHNSDKINKDIPFHHNLVMGMYYEGYTGVVTPNLVHMGEEPYYILNNHTQNMRLINLPPDTFMLNVGIVSTKLLKEVGGWDCCFEVCPCSYNDLAIRLQKYGVNFIIQHDIMYHCTHMPVRSGDHGPIHDAQTQHDEPLFRQIYSSAEYKDRTKVNIESWKNCPEIWTRRFGDDKASMPKSYSEIPLDTKQYKW